MIVYQLQGFGPITVEINVLAIALSRAHSPSHQQWLFASSLRAI